MIISEQVEHVCHFSEHETTRDYWRCACSRAISAKELYEIPAYIVDSEIPEDKVIAYRPKK